MGIPWRQGRFFTEADRDRSVAVLSTGGDLAAQNANLPTDFLLVLVALILIFMTLIEFVGRRRELGQSYLPEGMREALRKPLIRRKREAETA